MESFFVQKKKVIIEVAILIAFLAGVYFLYRMLSISSDQLSQKQASEQILGARFMLFLKSQDSLSFSTTSLNGKLIKLLTDYSQTIELTEARGRADPFAPYAPTGSIR